MDTHFLQNLFKIDKYPQITHFQLICEISQKPRLGPPVSKKFDIELPYILISMGFEPGKAFATMCGLVLLNRFLVKSAQNCPWLTPLLK